MHYVLRETVSSDFVSELWLQATTTFSLQGFQIKMSSSLTQLILYLLLTHPKDGKYKWRFLFTVLFQWEGNFISFLARKTVVFRVRLDAKH